MVQAVKLTDKQREAVIWRVQNEMADARKSLPCEERFWAVASVDDYLSSPCKATDRPLMHSLVMSVVRQHP